MRLESHLHDTLSTARRHIDANVTGCPLRSASAAFVIERAMANSSISSRALTGTAAPSSSATGAFTSPLSSVNLQAQRAVGFDYPRCFRP